MASRIIMRLELTPSAKKTVEQMTEKKGMTQVAMLSRLVEWLANQPAAVQASVLAANSSKTEAETAKLIVKQMGSGKKG
ncbi:MAG: hypothetical protein ACHRHE_22360 [Tepidisphaerales bacterium]